MIEAVAQADALEQGDGPLAALFVVVATQEDHGKLHVFEGAHCRQQVESLEDEADVAQTQLGEERVRRVLINAIAHDEKLARG